MTYFFNRLWFCLFAAFLLCRHKKQKEEDIAICVCRYDANDPDSACGERCLNVLTSTECTPGFCPCDIYCKNQVNAEGHSLSFCNNETQGWEWMDLKKKGGWEWMQIPLKEMRGIGNQA